MCVWGEARPEIIEDHPYVGAIIHRKTPRKEDEKPPVCKISLLESSYEHTAPEQTHPQNSAAGTRKRREEEMRSRGEKNGKRTQERV